jgi:CRISPR-associated endonuclease/helicase Cas3
MDNSEFRTVFEELTGFPPLRWQERLFHKHFAVNEIPRLIDLPTGLGKTMVMAIWLIALTVNRVLPRRLIYVVDRRTVVDQATDLATKLWESAAKALPGIKNLAVSTLRGQLADNREWTRDPSRPAIIIGTVDLIGSGLLFSGYRSSFKRRPLEAGSLGQDSLLVLDEAHLSKPFEKLVKGIEADGAFQKDRAGSLHGAPMRVIRMSATIDRSEAGNVFRLDADSNSPAFDLKTDPDPNTGEERNPIITRFTAKKRLTITTTDNLIDSIATASGEIAQSHLGARIVIFVRSPKQVDEICKALIRKDKSRETKIAMLTGTMRGMERDELLTPPDAEHQHERRVMQRFLFPGNDPSKGECFLISTSAGEVGFDLNADHMVCDAAPFDSMIQRLGRVNRRGQCDALVRLILENGPASKSEMEKACTAASRLFVNYMDVSSKALAEFRSNLSTDKLKAASTPEPTMVELTDILLDAWSMTTVTERMPGRPEVAPWLRGIDDDLPQTTIAWRAELDLPGFDQLDSEDIEEWFDTHRIRRRETLSVPTSAAAKWFRDRWAELPGADKTNVGERSAVVDRAGTKLLTVKELAEQLGRNTDSIRNADVIVPASFGGIERGKGVLDSTAPRKPQDEHGADEETRKENAKARRMAPDVADERLPEERNRYRELVITTAGGDRQTRSIASGSKPAKHSTFFVDLESDEVTRVQLFSYVPKQDKTEWGSKRQSLCEHVGLVRKCLDGILSRIVLPEPLKRAAQLAADYHDHGKNRERWQRTVDGIATPPGGKWRDQTLGKSGGAMKRDARHYRHEFGSLREFIDAHDGKTNAEVFDLAMHLIAAHHGRGRPHFPKGGFDPDAESRSALINTEVIRRFARLQRKYGWWYLAWLENLLRCADALASAESESGSEAEDCQSVSSKAGRPNPNG